MPVRKKDGSLRLAIDYRKLNQVTKKSAYPMARVDVLQEKLLGSAVYSKIDLTKGYYQIRLAEEDMAKTAFRFDGQLYEFTHMPFGLCSARQTFQRAMNVALQGVSNVACYMDDVLVFFKTIGEHKQHLEEVFKAFEKADLSMNPDKCQFGLSEIEFLGIHVIYIYASIYWPFFGSCNRQFSGLRAGRKQSVKKESSYQYADALCG